MRSLLLLALLLVLPAPQYFRDTRTIHVPAGPAPQVCTVLDAAVFAHAAPTLEDLRLYAGSPRPLPYAITISESTLLPPDPARILSVTVRGNLLELELAMPPRPYTQLDLTLPTPNFRASARVFGLRAETDKHPVPLGTFPLYDLSAQRLGRLTSLPLPESTFPFLRLAITVSAGPVSPAAVVSVQVPPARDAQSLYTPVAQTTDFRQRGHETVAQLDLPAHVPVERIRFILPPGFHANFSRRVQIHATHVTEKEPATPEDLDGVLSHVDLPAGSAGAPAIHQQSLTLPAVLVSNVQSAAQVEISIQNGDDLPVPWTAAVLEMRQRKLCFLATPAPSTVTLDYGDPGLSPPTYELARLFNPSAPTREATLGPEQLNPRFTPRLIPHRSGMQSHPELPWLALMLCVGVLAVLGFRARAR
jgi:hypothetical protein